MTLDVDFALDNRRVPAPGFYDGDGVYRVRFMPDTEGEWTYRTRSNVPALDGLSGTFRCGPPSEGNHGPVRVRNRYHFAYADGKPYFPFGTTCYAWTHQPLDMQRQTLADDADLRLQQAAHGGVSRSTTSSTRTSRFTTSTSAATTANSISTGRTSSRSVTSRPRSPR